MHKFCFALLLSLLSPALVAETRYISDEFRVPLRKSPCARCTIVHRGLKTGLKLDFIESVDDWSHVRTSSGLEGWIENQYITNTPIARDRLAQYQQRSKELNTNTSTLEDQVKQLKAENQQLSARLGAVSDDNEEVSSELAHIKEVSSNALNLNMQNQKLLQDNEMLQSKIDVLTALNKQFESSHTQKWFLYGAISVFLGALLSILLPRLKRKRRGHSEWT